MYIRPMPLETATEPFDSDDYIFEPKLDGRRMLISRIGGETKVYSATGQDLTSRYPEWAGVIPDGTIVEGEGGISEGAGGKARFTAYDIMWHRGRDIRSLPLMKRKEILAELPLVHPNIRVMPYVKGCGRALFASACRQGLEGIVAKPKFGRYGIRRGDRWIKVVNWTFQEVVITAYSKKEFGWLAAVPSEDGLVPAGWIRHGARAEHKRRFYEICREIECGMHQDTVFLEPLLRAVVKARGFERNGTLRAPVFLSFL